MKTLFSLFCIVLLFFSCTKNNQKRSSKDYFSSFLNTKSSIGVFGKVELNSLLKKMDYQSIPKLGFILNSVLNEFEPTININQPVYYALEGPFKTNGLPLSMYAFIEIENSDSLVKQLTQKGYDFNKKADLYLTQFENISIGINNDIALLIYNSENNSEQLIIDTFEKSKGELSKGKVKQILDQTGDITLALNIASLYSTSNTELEKLDMNKKKEISRLVNNSFISSSIYFERGEATLKIKNLFSKDLKDKLFFKTDPKSSILSKLGKGEPRFGLSTNIDVNKLERFINEYSPQAFTKIGEDLGGPIQMALMMGGKSPLSNILTGQIGLVLFGESTTSGGMVPDFNFYVGLGKNGNDLAQMAASFLSNSSMKFNIESNEISCFSSAKYTSFNNEKITIPSQCSFFGKKSITSFINLEGLDVNSFELDGPMKLIQIIKYTTFELDEEGAVFYVKSLNDNQNVLKQLIDIFIKDIEKQISLI